MAFIYFPAAHATLNTDQITRITWSTNEMLTGFVHLAGNASDQNSVVTLSDTDAEKLWGIMHPNESKPSITQ